MTTGEPDWMDDTRDDPEGATDWFGEPIEAPRHRPAGDISVHDMAIQVRQVLEAGDVDLTAWDAVAIAEDLARKHGLLDVDDIDRDAFWDVVGDHDPDLADDDEISGSCR